MAIMSIISDLFSYTIVVSVGSIFILIVIKSMAQKYKKIIKQYQINMLTTIEQFK